jgi:hypothetical protein
MIFLSIVIAVNLLASFFLASLLVSYLNSFGDAQIVLSSPWRTDDFFKDCLADIFVYYRLHAWIAETPEANDAYPFLFGGRMPRFSQDTARAIEIKAWLMRNDDPADYVVIDDRDVMYGHTTGFEHLFSDVKDHFYQTYKCGLRDRDIEKIVELASRWA